MEYKVKVSLRTYKGLQELYKKTGVTHYDFTRNILESLVDQAIKEGRIAEPEILEKSQHVKEMRERIEGKFNVK